MGGAMGGLAGAIWAPLTRYVSVDSFGFFALVLIVCFIFVGGYTTMWGPVVFVPILYGLILNLPTAIAQWGNVIFGGLLMLILVVRPEGVIDRRVLQVLVVLQWKSDSQLWGKMRHPYLGKV
jgi:ABC-type branched-subunit amino acid transport system permease subunit